MQTGDEVSEFCSNSHLRLKKRFVMLLFLFEKFLYLNKLVIQ